MKAWRLIKTKYASIAFDGEGARLFGGRWNSPGTRMVYTSSNSALAVLEVVVNMGDSSGVLASYSIIQATVPDHLIEDLDRSRLPADWKTSPAPPHLQAIGDEWIASGRSLALRVPSAVAPDGENILLNPQHADFGELGIGTRTQYKIDPRLL
ncbi:MAG: RES family NAD+ phosphorylase [Gemmatimonadaceae bacterium]